jgi:hypothetical protein
MLSKCHSGQTQLISLISIDFFNSQNSDGFPHGYSYISTWKCRAQKDMPGLTSWRKPIIGVFAPRLSKPTGRGRSSRHKVA